MGEARRRRLAGTYPEQTGPRPLPQARTAEIRLLVCRRCGLGGGTLADSPVGKAHQTEAGCERARAGGAPGREKKKPLFDRMLGAVRIPAER